MIASSDHGVGVGTAGGGATAVNVPCVPGHVTLEVTLAVVNGAGTENAAGFTVTDCALPLVYTGLPGVQA